MPGFAVWRVDVSSPPSPPCPAGRTRQTPAPASTESRL
ncbi:hypothetical protein X805_19610 [Sphaerotilus natans subsp. natans DSM 6575]|uniref:Uncharacterized protein n=1 Tax=Sphaerotilus natans subsp. natans DSM 6575 TaxID=1286631 RepID=A0A059KLK5_9BURK|nr:hypothetical protein X805_19610 [Sphaerotilus natans subsp. natans DSM 6575]